MAKGKVHWVIDLLAIRDGITDLIQALDNFGCGHTLFAHRDSVPTGRTLGENVIYYGGYEDTVYFRTSFKHWNPGVLYEPSKYAFYNYSTRIEKKDFLNHDYYYRTVGYLKKNWDLMHKMHGDKGMFVRPGFSDKEFEAFSTKELNIRLFGDVDDRVLCVTSSAKTISEEYRIVIIDHEVITGSSYKIANKKVVEMRVPHEIKLFAKEMGNKLYYDKAYMIDIGVLPSGEKKIIEISPFSCSAFYNCDREKIVAAINNLI